MKIPKGESLFDPKSVWFFFGRHLSVEEIVEKIAKVFAKAGDPRDRRKIKIGMIDA